MGTGICLFWTGKMGSTALGLNHWKWDEQFEKWDEQFEKWEWDFSSLVVS